MKKKGSKRRRQYKSIWDIKRDESMALIRELFSKRGPGPFYREELVVMMRDLYGLGALGKRIRKELSGDIRTAVRRGILDNAAGQYTILCGHIGRYKPRFLRAMLLAAIGRNWVHGIDAIRQAARYLGFRRVGSVIAKTLVSTINSALRRGELERNGPLIRRTTSQGNLGE